MSKLPIIAPKKLEEKIISFLRKTLNQTGFEKLIIGLSGGIDSTTSLYLINKVLPPENIIIAHLYYFQSQTSLIRRVCSTLKIPAQNQYILSIKKPVDDLTAFLNISNQYDNGRGRIGYTTKQVDQNHFQLRKANIMARIRMIILYDLAKKHSALVCGTENKSEHLLGYFTRFGDEASDIETIRHLYKSQVFELAKYLNVPKEIIKAKPTAGFWAGQTDEGQFGFSYKEADQVLYLSLDRGLDTKKITEMGFKNAVKILKFAAKNSFKHQTPYSL